jgi:hypothetical protein
VFQGTRIFSVDQQFGIGILHGRDEKPPIYFREACRVSRTWGMNQSAWAVRFSIFWCVLATTGTLITCLHLNLGLRNVLLAAAAVGDLLGLGELVADGLGAEVLEGVGLDSVDAQGRVGLDDGETS